MSDDLTTVEYRLADCLKQLPRGSRASVALELAARLVESAADAHATIKPGQDVVQMILLAAQIDAVAKRHGVQASEDM